VLLPSYSLDLTPCDFFLFPLMNKNIKGKPFENVVEVKTKTMSVQNIHHKNINTNLIKPFTVTALGIMLGKK